MKLLTNKMKNQIKCSKVKMMKILQKLNPKDIFLCVYSFLIYFCKNIFKKLQILPSK